MNPPNYQISISVPAYFRVELPDLSYVYTLGRKFKISSAGLLVTEEDYPFFEHLQLTEPYTNPLNITELGVVTQLINEVLTPVGQIKAILFQYPENLEDLGNGYFLPTIASGVPVVGNPGDPLAFLNLRVYSQILYNIPLAYPHVVMKVHILDYNGILTLARAVVAAIIANPSIFSNPDPPLSVIIVKINSLVNLISTVDAGDHAYIQLRNEAGIDLYHSLQKLAVYINLVANGDRGILELSGYTVIDAPSPKPAPEKVEITKITDGPHPKTIKIYIHKMLQYPLLFKVQATLTSNVESSWEIVLATRNSKELIITDRVYGQECWYRVNASNANGDGLWSEPISFISLT